MVLVGGLGGHACESRQGLGGAPDPQHDAEKHSEYSERVVVGLSTVREELAPAVQVGKLLHDPQRVHVVLHQVRGDRPEHRKSTGDTRDEGDGRRLVRLVGDCLLREPVDLGQGDSGEQRIRVNRARNCIIIHAEFAQLLAQELLAVDAHAGYAHDLFEELDRMLFDVIPLISRQMSTACIMLDFPGISQQFTMSTKILGDAPHIVPLHCLVTSTRGLDTRQL